MAGPEVLFVEERVEDKRFFGASGSGRRRVGSVTRIEHARFVRGLSLGIRRRGDDGGAVRSARARRQVQPTLAAAATERKRNHAQEYDGPSRSCRAQMTDHDDIPKSGRTIQRLLHDGECTEDTKLQRNWYLQSNFRCFSSRFAHALACEA